MIQPEAAERLWGGQSVRAIMHSSSFRDCQVGDAALGRCSYIIFCREVAWRRSDAGCVFGARGGDDGLARSDSEHMFKWKYGGVGANTRTQKLAEPLQPANVFVCSFLYTHVNTFVFDNSNIKKKTKTVCCWMRRRSWATCAEVFTFAFCGAVIYVCVHLWLFQAWRAEGLPLSTTSNEACKLYDALLTQVASTTLILYCTYHMHTLWWCQQTAVYTSDKTALNTM